MTGKTAETPKVSRISLGKGMYAIVDDHDFDWLSEFHWWAMKGPGTKPYYAVMCGPRNGGSTPVIFMHRLILGLTEGLDRDAGKQGDHINRNTLDNRRENLRICSGLQNSRNKGLLKSNSVGFKGVEKIRNKWRARIGHTERKHLGMFDSAEAAARAYDAAAKKHFGEFAALNFPD